MGGRVGTEQRSGIGQRVATGQRVGKGQRFGLGLGAMVAPHDALRSVSSINYCSVCNTGHDMLSSWFLYTCVHAWHTPISHSVGGFPV
jgi:hypothetical protein